MMGRRLKYTTAVMLLLTVSALAPAAPAAGPMHDFVIRNGLICDGSEPMGPQA